MKPTHWRLTINGVLTERRYFQRAAANGAAIILRAQGHAVNVKGQWQ